MKIAISGCSGFVGTHLRSFLENKGDEVVSLKHDIFEKEDKTTLEKLLQGSDLVINLAGVSINQRWNKKVCDEILQSRIKTTHLLVECINRMDFKPSAFLSASAVGIYPYDGVSTEKTIKTNNGFLSQVCRLWEAEANNLCSQVRLVIMRFGIILSKDGGALPKMILPFKFFVGAEIASGKQGFSWIHINDLINGIYFIMQHQEVCGVVNLVAPGYTDNKELSKVIGKVMRRPCLFTVPAIVFKIFYGAGEELFIKGQKVYPERMLALGYDFSYPEIKQALSDILI